MMKFTAIIKLEVTGRNPDAAMQAAYEASKRLSHVRKVQLHEVKTNALIYTWSPREGIRRKSELQDDSKERLALELLQAGMPLDLVIDAVKE